MIFGIEESTDMRVRAVTIERFSSERQALSWREGSGRWTFPGNADTNLHPQQQNWHRNLRSVYRTEPGFRLDMRQAKRERDRQCEARGWYAGTYGLPTVNEIAAQMIRANAAEIEK